MAKANFSYLQKLWQMLESDSDWTLTDKQEHTNQWKQFQKTQHLVITISTLLQPSRLRSRHSAFKIFRLLFVILHRVDTIIRTTVIMIPPALSIAVQQQ